MKYKQWGTYVVVTFDRKASAKEKLSALRLAVNRIITDAGKWNVTPKEDTINIILHEGWLPTTNDWYEDEKQPPKEQIWGMTVGIKFTEDNVNEEEKA